MWFTIMMGAAMCAVVALLVREAGIYRRTRTPFTLRRLTLRVSMAGMLLYLLGSILFGVRVFALDSPHGNASLWMAFWTCIALLTGAILCLVLADLRLLSEEHRSVSRQLFQEISATLAAQQHTPDPTEPPRE